MHIPAGNRPPNFQTPSLYSTIFLFIFIIQLFKSNTPVPPQAPHCIRRPPWHVPHATFPWRHRLLGQRREPRQWFCRQSASDGCAQLTHLEPHTYIDRVGSYFRKKSGIRVKNRNPGKKNEIRVSIRSIWTPDTYPVRSSHLFNLFIRNPDPDFFDLPDSRDRDYIPICSYF